MLFDYTHDIPLLLVKVKVKITVCKTKLIHLSYNLTAKVAQKMENDANTLKFIEKNDEAPCRTATSLHHKGA